jgi:glutamine synthetase
VSDKPSRLSVGRKGFIDEHGLWGEPERHAAAEAIKRAAAENLTTIRFAVPDQHGIVRGKTLAARLFPQALTNGIDFPVAPFFFDTANAIVFDPFIEGGGFGMEEMTGDPNCVLVPDPTTFTILPWTPKTGWILCEMFFSNGQPLPFDARRIFRNALEQAKTAGFTYVTGLEVEWYLTRMVDNMLGGGELGGPGNPAPAPIVTPASHGFQYLLEDHNDEIDDVLQALLRTMTDLGLPIRSLEDEWGPGQVEMTFDPMDGIRSADAMILFRAATKQV